jgi:hypothetical protein
MVGPYTQDLDIAHMALMHLGDTSTLTNFSTGTTIQDRAINRFFNQTKHEILRMHDWSFAKKVAALTDQATDPNEFWRYSYTYPTDCLFVRRLRWYVAGPGARIDSETNRIAYEIDQNQGKIFTDLDDDDGYLEYTENVSTYAEIPADFGLAWSYLLAARIAPAVAGLEKNTLFDFCMKMHGYAMGIAQANDFNEDNSGAQHHEPTYIRERGTLE